MADQNSFNSTLQDRISALKKKQRELELIAKVVEFATNLPSQEQEFKDVAEKVASLFISFSNKAMDNLSSEKVSVTASPAKIVKSEPVAVEPAKPQPPAEPSVGEKLKFLQTWKHLENKKVKVEDKFGTVRGLDAPRVVIVLEDGNTVNIEPEKLNVVQKGR